MTPQTTPLPHIPPAAEPQPLLVGIDWADRQHDVAVRGSDGRVECFRVEADPDALDGLLRQLQARADGRPIAVCLEKSRTSLVYHLMLQENVLLDPVDPKQFARYRESFSSSGAKDDPTDAALLVRLLAERRDQLRRFEPDDALTRLIGQLSRTRRAVVDDRTRLTQQLLSTLKTYFPLVLALAGGRSASPLLREIVRRWPDPRQFRRTHPQTLRKLLRRHAVSAEHIEQHLNTIRAQPLVSRDRAVVEPAAIRAQALIEQIAALDKAVARLEEQIQDALRQHPDAPLFTALPGAGQALAPRLLAAFGSQRDRYQNADELAALSGIAPVTRQSGKTRHVSRRRGCPKYLRQTFHEFADAARKWCPWSKAYYRLLRARSMAHHAALRKLASRWIRILYQVWKTRTPYDPQRYLHSLRTKNHPLLQYLEESSPSLETT